MPFKRLPWITAIPNPSVNASTRAVITSMKGGIATVKYGFNSAAAANCAVLEDTSNKYG